MAHYHCSFNSLQPSDTSYAFMFKSSFVHVMACCLFSTEPSPEPTRTIRTPLFWGYPLPPHDYPYYWVILDPKSKGEQSYKFKEFAKITNFWILKQTLHATHLKLLDKMCKYEMDPTSIVEDTARTRLCPQTDRLTDGQTDGQTRRNQYTPFQIGWSGGYNVDLSSVRKTLRNIWTETGCEYDSSVIELHLDITSMIITHIISRLQWVE